MEESHPKGRYTGLQAPSWAVAERDDDADTKMILTAPTPDNWKRPPGSHHAKPTASKH